MAARLLALLAAVAMVVVAVAVRDRMDDDDERASTTLRLVCSTELEAVCEALAGEAGGEVDAAVEVAADTAARLAAVGPGADAGLDGWLVAGPWPDIVDDERERRGTEPLLEGGGVLARSPVVLAVWPERAEVLGAHCGGGPGWRCLGEVAGEPWASLPGGREGWGPVTPGLPPASTAAGLTVLAAATAAFLERLPESSADLADQGYRDWLDRLLRAVPGDTTPSVESMVLRPSSFDAVGALEAEAGPLLTRSQRDRKPALLYPEPVVTADVVLGTTGGRAAELLRDLVAGPAGRRALAGAGWRVPGEEAVAGVGGGPPLPDASGLPAAGVLEALRRLAEGVR